MLSRRARWIARGSGDTFALFSIRPGSGLYGGAMATLGERILAGDVGGTKTVLSLYERAEEGWREVATSTFASAEHASLEPPARAFVDAHGAAVTAAAFGVAGPVAEGKSRITQLPWVIEARALGAALGTERIALVNDFEATARGLVELGPSQLVVLQPGKVTAGGHVAVLGAGTGIGEAILVPTDRGPRVLPTEGGHSDFAPRDELEDALLRWLRRRHPDHVSVERVISGPGLAAIHAFLVDSGLAPSAAPTLARMAEEDAGAVIGELGLRGADEACVRAVRMFVSLYGAEAGNFALKTLPTGGLFVAGGIAPKLLPLITGGLFLESFLAKGRMRPVLERVRVSVVTDPRVGIHGARALAASLL
jgi:glucokinase